jgi:hypothetical protein
MDAGERRPVKGGGGCHAARCRGNARQRPGYDAGPRRALKAAPRLPMLRALLLMALFCAGAAVLAQEKREDKGATFEDSVITQRVSSALGRDPLLMQMHITVQTREGVVHLTGFVDSMSQLERAALLARRVEGVSGVKNAIRVAIRPSRASSEFPTKGTL